MKSWVYCLPTDVLGEGAQFVIATLRARAGADGIAIGVKYHASRDVFPHNPRWHVASLPPGVYYQPRPGGHGVINPRMSPLSAGRDVLAEVVESAANSGIAVSAWAVMLHDDTVEADHPAVQVNCWGEGAAGLLCPAHPATRDYVRLIVRQLTAYPITSLRLESLHYHGIHHGYHHERLLETYSPLARWLLGLCFCRHCEAAATSLSVDVERLRTEVQRWLAAAFDSPPEDVALAPTELSRLFGEDLLGYIAAREGRVSSIVADVVDTAGESGVSTTFIDMTLISSGKLVAPGVGILAIDAGWLDGIDIQELAACGADIEVTGYVNDLGRLTKELGAYRAVVGRRSRLNAILRLGSSEHAAADDLSEGVAVARTVGCDEIAFYNYGLYRLAALDAVRSATRPR